MLCMDQRKQTSRQSYNSKIKAILDQFKATFEANIRHYNRTEMDRSPPPRGSFADRVSIALPVLFVNVLLIFFKAERVKRLVRGMGAWDSRERADTFYEAIQLQTLNLLPSDREEHFQHIYQLLTKEASKWNMFQSRLHDSSLRKLSKKLSSETFPLHEHRCVIALDEQDTARYILTEGVSAHSRLMTSSCPTEIAVRTWAKSQLKTLRQTYDRAPTDEEFHRDPMIIDDDIRKNNVAHFSYRVADAAGIEKQARSITKTDSCNRQEGFEASSDCPSGTRQGSMLDQIDELIADTRARQSALNTSNPATDRTTQDTHNTSPSNAMLWRLQRQSEIEWRLEKVEGKTPRDTKNSQMQMANTKSSVYESDSWEQILSHWRRETEYFGPLDAEDDYP